MRGMLTKYSEVIKRFKSRGFRRGGYITVEPCTYEFVLNWRLLKLLPAETTLTYSFGNGRFNLDTKTFKAVVTVDAGYGFDGISCAPTVRGSVNASLIHDWIYEHAPDMAYAWRMPRRRVLRIADVLFDDVMRYTGVTPWVRRLYYWGARLFGYPYNLLERAAAEWCEYWA